MSLLPYCLLHRNTALAQFGTGMGLYPSRPDVGPTDYPVLLHFQAMSCNDLVIHYHPKCSFEQIIRSVDHTYKNGKFRQDED